MSMIEKDLLKRIVEGAIFTAGEPVTIDRLLGMFSEHELIDAATIRNVLNDLEQDCEFRGYELKQVASGYRFQVKQDVSPWLIRLWDEKPPKYSRAVLETLALIAYRQPVTRAEIEDIRGVTGSSAIIKTLMDREWVRIVGHRDVPGKPGLYATTKYFLDYFNLKSLDELPTLADLMDLDAASDRLEEQLQLDLSIHLNQGLPVPNEDLELADKSQDDETNDDLTTISTEPSEEAVMQDIEAFVEETIDEVMHDAEAVDEALESIEEALESVGEALEEITSLEEITEEKS